MVQITSTILIKKFLLHSYVIKWIINAINIQIIVKYLPNTTLHIILIS